MVGVGALGEAPREVRRQRGQGTQGRQACEAGKAGLALASFSNFSKFWSINLFAWYLANESPLRRWLEVRAPDWFI